MANKKIYGQNNKNHYPHGTILVAVICKDGILFATDSRSSFTITNIDANGKSKEDVFAYMNNDKKLYQAKDYFIAVSGLSMFNKKYVRDLVSNFNKTIIEKLKVEEIFDGFLNFLITENNLTKTEIFNENTFIIAGYENSKPKIISQQKENRSIGEDIGRMFYSDILFKQFVQFEQSKELTCANLYPVIEKAINDYAEYRNDYKVGGPVEIIQIKPDNTHLSLRSFKPNNYKTYEETAKAIFNNQIEVHYLYPESQEKLKSTLLEGIRLGY
jgi:hypothetical protein